MKNTCFHTQRYRVVFRRPQEYVKTIRKREPRRTDHAREKSELTSTFFRSFSAPYRIDWLLPLTSSFSSVLTSRINPKQSEERIQKSWCPKTLYI